MFANAPDEGGKNPTKTAEVLSCVLAGTYSGASYTSVITRISGVERTIRPVWKRGFPWGQPESSRSEAINACGRLGARQLSPNLIRELLGRKSVVAGRGVGVRVGRGGGREQ